MAPFSARREDNFQEWTFRSDFVELGSEIFYLFSEKDAIKYKFYDGSFSNRGAFFISVLINSGDLQRCANF